MDEAAFRQEWSGMGERSGKWGGCAFVWWWVRGTGRGRAQLSQVANTHPFPLDKSPVFCCWKSV